MQKEAVMAYFRTLCILQEALKKGTKTSSAEQDSMPRSELETSLV
jgi:hypothetical protein